VNASSVAVLRARLPYVDRRALSEAWFSALHLTKDERSSPARRRANASSVNSTMVPARESSTRNAGPSPRDSVTRRPSRSDGGYTARELSKHEERQQRVSPTPRRPMRYPPVRASFQLAIDGGRVQILVRRQGATLHVVALCSARHVELVRRALACADLHLRANGERVESSVRAFDATSGAR
jgi:hypothetical protein